MGQGQGADIMSFRDSCQSLNFMLEGFDLVLLLLRSEHHSGVLPKTEGADARLGAWLLPGTTLFLFLEETVSLQLLQGRESQDSFKTEPEEEWSLSERTLYGNIPKPSNLFIWEGGRGKRGGQRGMAHMSCFSDFPLFTVHLHCIITPVCFRKEAGGRQGALWGRWLT